MEPTQWIEINTELYVLADLATGEILAKIAFKDFWQYKRTEYLTLIQAQAAVENAIIAEKINREQDNLPWNA